VSKKPKAQHKQWGTPAVQCRCSTCFHLCCAFGRLDFIKAVPNVR